MKRKQQRTGWLVAAVVAVGTSVAAAAEDVTIKQPAASVLSGKTARSAKVAQLTAGDRVQVLGREGSWLRVRVGGKEGYVHENSIGSGGGGGLSQTIAKASGASALSSGEAGRGVGDSAAAWAGAKSMNTAGLTRMVAVRNALNDSDWQKFQADGAGRPR